MIHGPQEYLRDIVGELADSQAESLMITGAWSLRDVIAHLVSWAEEFQREVAYVLDAGGGKLPWTISTHDNYSQWNQARIDEMEGLSCSELMERFAAANKALEDLILSSSEEQLALTADIPWYYPPHLELLDIISVKSHHELRHIARIEEKSAGRKT